MKFGLVAVCLSGLVVGCASTSDGSADPMPGDEQDITAGAAAQQACGTAKFNEALPHYKEAVNDAKARENDVCAEGPPGSSGYRSSITDAAARAVFICPAFKDVIKNSPFAEPIRKVLGDVLTLRSLTGELLVLRDSQFANWSGVEALLPGTTMWSDWEFGLLFTQDSIEFKANGQGVHSHLSGETGDYEKTPFTYRVVKTGADKDARKVVIEMNGKSITYDLGVKKVPASDFDTAPVFELLNDGHGYNTTEDECSA